MGNRPIGGHDRGGLVGCLCGVSDWKFILLSASKFVKLGLYLLNMDWANWQTYAAVAIVLITLGVFVGRGLKTWLVGSDKNCCGGRCGCGVSKGADKLKM